MPARSAPILVVESHPDVRVALQMALEFVGYDVRVAADAAQAREALERMGRPGLLLVDESLLRQVSRTLALGSLPIVLLSMDEQPRSPEVQAVLRKPFSLDRLYAVVKAHCEVRDVPRVLRLAGRIPAGGGSAPLAEDTEVPVRRLGLSRM